jgi:hypothetical protein
VSGPAKQYHTDEITHLSVGVQQPRQVRVHRPKHQSLTSVTGILPDIVYEHMWPNSLIAF